MSIIKYNYRKRCEPCTKCTGDYVTTETDPTVPFWVKAVTQAQISKWDGLAKDQVVDAIEDLQGYPGESKVILVKDEKRGGLFFRSTENLTQDNGIIFTSSDNNFWIRRVDDYSKVNAQWFGAIGNEINNDTKPIQDALDYVDNIGGGTVVLPKGTYRLSHTVFMGSNTTLLGDVDGILTKLINQADDGNFWKIGGAIISGKNYDKNEYLHNIRIENIFLHNKELYALNPDRIDYFGTSIGFGMVNNLNIINCRRDYAASNHFLDLTAIKNSSIRGNYSEPCGGNNTNIQVESYKQGGGIDYAVVPNDTTYTNVPVTVPVGEISENVTVSENLIFINNDSSSDRVSGIDVHGGYSIGAINITIKNNTIANIDTTQNGLETVGINHSNTADNLQSVYIHNNTFKNLKYPVKMIGDVDTLYFINNVIVSNQSDTLISYFTPSQNKGDIYISNNSVDGKIYNNTPFINTAKSFEIGDYHGGNLTSNDLFSVGSDGKVFIPNTQIGTSIDSLLVKSTDGEIKILNKGAAITNITTPPTAEQFNALLNSLRTVGLIES